MSEHNLEDLKKDHELYMDLADLENLRTAAAVAAEQFVTAKRNLVQIMGLAMLRGYKVDPETGELQKNIISAICTMKSH
jgi:hypothetical protein